jgi:hypothetical protein
LQLKDKPINDQTPKHSRQIGSEKKVLLFIVSKQNLNPFIGTSSALKIVKNAKSWQGNNILLGFQSL